MKIKSMAELRKCSCEETLSEDILFHKRRYYSGNAVVSDEFYDALEDRLRELNPNHPTLSVVGGGE